MRMVISDLLGDFLSPLILNLPPQQVFGIHAREDRLLPCVCLVDVISEGFESIEEGNLM